VGGLGDLARGVAPAQPLVLEVLRMPPVTRFAVDGVTGGEEPGRHVSAHVPEADEAEHACRARAHPAAPPSAALTPAMIAPPSATETNEPRKPVPKKRDLIQESVRSSKAITATATISAERYCGIRNGSVCRIP